VASGTTPPGLRSPSLPPGIPARQPCSSASAALLATAFFPARSRPALARHPALALSVATLPKLRSDTCPKTHSPETEGASTAAISHTPA
jgi:hypothetical protein